MKEATLKRVSKNHFTEAARKGGEVGHSKIPKAKMDL